MNKINGADVFLLSADFFQGNSGASGLPRLTVARTTATLPIFVSATDTDTGLGMAGANVASLIAGGVNVLNANSSGKVGVGTTNPVSKLQVVGAIASGYTAAFTTAGPTDNLDVSLKNTLFVDTSGNSVTIGGLAGGVAGQSLRIVKTSALNTLTLENVEGGGSQDIYLSSCADEAIAVGCVGAWVLECNGTSWFVSSSTGVESSMAALSMVDYTTNSYTAGAATILLEWEVNRVTAGFTTTSSNIVNHVAGWYDVSQYASLQGTTAAAELECYLYTNGVLALDAGGNKIGFDVTLSAAATHVNPSFYKSIYLAANTTNDIRITTVDNETLEFEHGAFTIERK
jgi:hypothetical protein